MSPEAGSKQITLNPPLPFQSQDFSGSIDALGDAGLWMTTEKESREFSKGQQAQISISTSHQERISVDVEFSHQKDGRWFGTPTGPARQNTWQDLKNLIRKEQHISICQNTAVEASDRYTGFEDVNLLPRAIPQLAMEDIDLTTRIFGEEFSAPALITGMTGGVAKGAEINRRLARCAAHFHIPMGVGSQRMALENHQYRDIFTVKDEVPGVFLIGNIGATQLASYRTLGFQSIGKMADALIQMIDANAIAIHVNVLQELIQVEGDRDFRNLIPMIGEFVAASSVPVVVKEVGCGIDPQSIDELKDVGVKTIDIGGKGGTSWSYIEGQRGDEATRTSGDAFRNFGLPTAIALSLGADSRHSDLDFIATGGIRDGLTIAKALGLGATAAGIGLPLFRAALLSDQAPIDLMANYLDQLKVAMLVSGCRTAQALRKRTKRNHKFRQLQEDFSADG